MKGCKLARKAGVGPTSGPTWRLSHALVTESCGESEQNGSERGWTATHYEPEIHRVDPEFGSTLTVSNRDSQSNCWVNLRILGQPCEFYLIAVIERVEYQHLMT